jgi:hypothetical protein
MVLMSFCDFFSSFTYTFHIWNRKWKWHRWIFSSGLVFLITRFMEHFMRPTPIYRVQNSGRDPRTRRTDGHTDRDDRSKTQIHSKWICVKTKLLGASSTVCGDEWPICSMQPYYHISCLAHCKQLSINIKHNQHKSISFEYKAIKMYTLKLRSKSSL